MTKFRKLAMAAALSGAAAFSLGTGAMAATVTAKLSSVEGVTVNIASTSTTPPVSRPAQAGAFNMTGGVGGIVGDFVAFCVDIVNTVHTGTTYTYDIGASKYGASIVASVQALFDANYGAVKDGTQADKAAFQVALWSTLYDNFTFSGVSDGAVQAYLDAAGEYAGAKKWQLSWLVNGADAAGNSPVQDLVAVAPVPVPAAGFLLMGGLAGLGVMARRRKAAAA